MIKLLLFLTPCVISYNFLVFCPLFAYSHTSFFARIADILSDAGHNVTFFSPTILREFQNTTYVKSTKHVVKLEPWRKEKTMLDILPSGSVENFWSTDSSLFEFLPTIKLFQRIHQEQSEWIFKNIEVLDNLKKTHKYDAIIYETFIFAAYPVMDYLDIKTQIPAISITHDVEMARALGETVMPTVTVDSMSSFDEKMTICQRIFNTLVTPFVQLIMGYPEYLSYTQPRVPVDYPSRRYKSSFLLTNSNPYLDFPRPTITKTVQIGGMTVDMEKMRKEKVDKKMDEILNQRSSNLLISFGSIQRSHRMPDSFKTAIIEALSKFPDVTFIWKYESDNHSEFSRNLPNVHFLKWVPQLAMLVDPRLTAFFTHGGLGSVNEISYTGKPSILCPIFGDQARNAKMLVRHGGAIEYSKFDLDNPLKLENAIRNILYDPKYQENAKNLARRLEKQPIKPAELLVKHCEFAAEFGELPSLDPYSRQMSFISYFMIDIVFIFLFTITVFLIIIYYVVRSVFVHRKSVKTD